MVQTQADGLKSTWSSGESISLGLNPEPSCLVLPIKPPSKYHHIACKFWKTGGDFVLYYVCFFSGPAALGPSLGMSYVDPTPVPSHMISAKVVEGSQLFKVVTYFKETYHTVMNTEG